MPRTDRWLERLAATRHVSGYAAGHCLASDRLAVRPATSFRLDDPVGDGWIAVGDAASSFDPIAAQGIHKALEDGLLAADVVAARLRGGDRAAEYRGQVAARFHAYARAREWLYGRERRWPAAPFWVRRRQRRVVRRSAW